MFSIALSIGGVNGYSGPSLNTLLTPDKQTLINGSSYILGPNDDALQNPTTQLSFTKYLREPNEIEIDPYKSTLLLYAVASIDDDGNYNDNPDWKFTYVTLLEDGIASSKKKKMEVVRKRLRRHEGEFGDVLSLSVVVKAVNTSKIVGNDCS